MQSDEVRSSYDMVAEVYAQKFFDELTRKPFDRRLTALPARLTLDVGCGPGHVAGYLSKRGLDVTGVDLSPAMVKIARQLNPEIRFHVADMRNLPAADSSFGGIAAFYSVIHIPRENVPGVLLEFRRVLILSGPASDRGAQRVGDHHNSGLHGQAGSFRGDPVRERRAGPSDHRGRVRSHYRCIRLVPRVCDTAVTRRRAESEPQHYCLEAVADTPLAVR